ncbi:MULTISPECIES: hypothetical protein [Alphaproteobacteria]|jgi:hypothetical protein|uniref:Uncharacterized protein n=1 Tax=Edaphosphingomonas fennica TaxID=114404 RepID=A0A2T4I4X8_9SPHN|nr:hypothetical protein [Novosphingobium aquimarinum]PTD24935.1 hypothetical protein CV103_06820 [Sphingomonas fennica]RSV21255.1 hypothetical protein CA237_16620 [Sphingomonas sp. ABOLH]
MNPERLDKGAGEVMWHVEGDRIERLHDLSPFITKGEASIIWRLRGRCSIDRDTAVDPSLSQHR